MCTGEKATTSFKSAKNESTRAEKMTYRRVMPLLPPPAFLWLTIVINENRVNSSYNGLIDWFINLFKYTYQD